MKGAVMADRIFSRRKFMKITGLGTAALAVGGCSGGSAKKACTGKAKSQCGKGDSMTRKLMTRELPGFYDGEYENLRIGICQVYTEQWAIEDNLKRTIAAIEEAAKQGADIAITPECVLHAYAERTDNFFERLLEVAEPVDGKNIQQVCKKAKELNIHVLIGFMERGAGNKIHNSAALISNEGKIIYVYRKVHCRPFESIEQDGYFTPGEEFYAAELKFGDRRFKVGTMICFDREITESVRCLRALGSEIILCPLATDTYEMSKYVNIVDNEIVTRCRAAENEVFIVVVNHAGRQNGGSLLVGPSGELLYQSGNDTEVHVMDVPLGIVSAKFHGKPLGLMGW